MIMWSSRWLRSPTNNLGKTHSFYPSSEKWLTHVPMFKIRRNIFNSWNCRTLSLRSLLPAHLSPSHCCRPSLPTSPPTMLFSLLSGATLHRRLPTSCATLGSARVPRATHAHAPPVREPPSVRCAAIHGLVPPPWWPCAAAFHLAGVEGLVIVQHFNFNVSKFWAFDLNSLWQF